NGAHKILKYAVAGKNSAVAYKGIFGSGTIDGGLVYLAFALETANQEDQTQLVGAALDYFEETITGIEAEFIEKRELSFDLYPNPFLDNVYMKVTFDGSLEKQWVLTIYNLEGKIMRQSAHNFSFGTQTLDLKMSEYNRGIYWVVLSSGKIVTSKKLVKK
ncbi:hypothetical protein MNBD_BACTEROID06-1861, partial [hydrothermal vent metagenome]